LDICSNRIIVPLKHFCAVNILNPSSSVIADMMSVSEQLISRK
jgi:hypothetical protein